MKKHDVKGVANAGKHLRLFGVVYQKLLEGYDKSKCSIVYYNVDT